MSMNTTQAALAVKHYLPAGLQIFFRPFGKRWECCYSTRFSFTEIAYDVTLEKLVEQIKERSDDIAFSILKRGDAIFVRDVPPTGCISRDCSEAHSRPGNVDEEMMRLSKLYAERRRAKVAAAKRRLSAAK